MKKILFFLVLLAALGWSAANAQVREHYYCNFNNNSDLSQWTLLNGSCTNVWRLGRATPAHSGIGSYTGYGLYITNDGGTTNAYSTTEAISLVYAYHEVDIVGDTTVTLSFYWRAYGEDFYDYLRVALIPDDYTIEAGTNKPANPTFSKKLFLRVFSSCPIRQVADNQHSSI